jgi:nitroreductase
VTIQDALKRVRSVRQYADRAVDEAIILRILDAGRWAGSAKNTQPWRYLLVQERATLERLASCGHYASHVAHAAFAVIVVMPSGGFADFDAGRTIQNMLVSAWAEGVGSCVVTLSDEAQVREILGVPENYQVRHCVAFGYALEGVEAQVEGQPLRKVLANMGRKPIETLLHRERWDADNQSEA